MSRGIGYFLLNSIMTMFAILILPIIAGVIVGMLLAGCGGPITKGNAPAPSNPTLSCTVSQTETVVTISCPDNTKASLPLSAPNPTPTSQPVTTVQLCEGTTSYPNTFPEQALCVDNSLYGVFFDGQNAWLSLLPPGAYRSTSTSDPCNFTVISGCLITR